MTRATVAVIGLGYVGLPLAVALADHVPTTGFDIDEGRIDQLRRGHDRTNEVSSARLGATGLELTARVEETAGHDVYIVTVPTPVDPDNEPDLGPLRAACRSVGGVIRPGAIVVFESTVYPGVTESVCGPLLEQVSGLRCGVDFFLGYSPERINPGDREHTVDRITKVVAGQTPDVTETLADLYGRVTSGGVFRAASIKAAEAAKVIENAQRDINVAFINEVTMIFQRLGLSIYDVLDASATKWNFLNFKPGLVGGHCIGVDPFYLARCALDNGHNPEIVLAGRRINDSMGAYVARRVFEQIDAAGRRPRVLVLGLTFKENVPDTRNTKVVDVVSSLRDRGCAVDIHDPLADRAEARAHYGLDLLDDLSTVSGYDALVTAVAHDAYLALTPEDLSRLVAPGGLVADIKGVWRGRDLPPMLRVWRL